MVPFQSLGADQMGTLQPSPTPFKPRGYGNLFARPSTSHRMDYSRPYLIDPYSEYGPSYYVRQPDPNCCCRDPFPAHVTIADSNSRTIVR